MQKKYSCYGHPLDTYKDEYELTCPNPSCRNTIIVSRAKLLTAHYLQLGIFCSVRCKSEKYYPDVTHREPNEQNKEWYARGIKTYIL